MDFEPCRTLMAQVVVRDLATKCSRGSGFLTYVTVEKVGAAGNARPHQMDGRVVEPKKAVSRGDFQGLGAHFTVKKISGGGIKDDIEEHHPWDYFGQCGRTEVTEIITDKKRLCLCDLLWLTPQTRNTILWRTTREKKGKPYKKWPVLQPARAQSGFGNFGGACGGDFGGNDNFGVEENFSGWGDAGGGYNDSREGFGNDLAVLEMAEVWMILAVIMINLQILDPWKEETLETEVLAPAVLEASTLPKHDIRVAMAVPAVSMPMTHFSFHLSWTCGM